jgi:hypothetical protein
VSSGNVDLSRGIGVHEGDKHIPYHCYTADALIDQIMEAFPVAIYTQCGDLSDMYSVSTFDRDPKRHGGVGSELKQSVAYLERRRQQVMSGGKAVLTLGNHDDRLRRFIWKNPSMVDVDELNMLARYRKTGVLVYEYGDSAQLTPHLWLTHDFGMSGKSALSAAVAKFGASVLFGHTHMAGTLYENEIAAGRSHVGINLGWTGDVNQLGYGHKQRAIKTHRLGIVVTTHTKSGLFAHAHVPFMWEGNSLVCCVLGKWFKQKRVSP